MNQNMILKSEWIPTKTNKRVKITYSDIDELYVSTRVNEDYGSCKLLEEMTYSRL